MELSLITKKTSKTGKKMAYLSCSSCGKLISMIWVNRHTVKCKSQLVGT